MKKIFGIFLLIVLLFCCCSCNKAENEILKNNKTHFSAVTNFALSYHSENHNDTDEHITLVFDNGKIKNEGAIVDIAKALSNSVKIIEENDFDYLWVDENYVIFWKDETKYYGLLWSECVTDIIKTMKNEWFSALEYNKIDGDWYEIGVLSAI